MRRGVSSAAGLGARYSRKRGNGAAFSFVDGQMVPLQFEKMLNPQTGRFQVRKVNVDGDAYECACH